MRADELGKFVKRMEIGEDGIVVYADENLEKISDYLNADRGILEIEDDRLILKPDKNRESKFKFVLQCAYVLERYVNELHEKEGIGEDLFSTIIGYEDIKTLFIKAIKAERPVHILLIGPESTAKTLFLTELEKLPNSFLFLGGEMTHAGLRDVIAEYKPRYLIIDELDKIRDASDISSLLSWMESGRIVITKHKNREMITGKSWVFAACNRTDKFPKELLSRFLKLKLKEYSKAEFKEIVKNILYYRECVEKELAEYIAEKCVEYNLVDVRDAVRIGRLAKSKEEVDGLLSIFQLRVR
jgi:hypothetical protein